MRPNYINKYTTLQHLSHHFTSTHSHKYTGKPHSNLLRVENLMMISRTNFHDFHFHMRGKVWRERRAKKQNRTDILLSSLMPYYWVKPAHTTEFWATDHSCSRWSSRAVSDPPAPCPDGSEPAPLTARHSHEPGMDLCHQNCTQYKSDLNFRIVTMNSFWLYKETVLKQIHVVAMQLSEDEKRKEKNCVS